MNEWRLAIPLKLNGPQLIEELNLTDLYTHDDELVLVGELTEQQAIDGLAAHVPQPTQAEIDAQNRTQAIADAEAHGWTPAMIAVMIP